MGGGLCPFRLSRSDNAFLDEFVDRGFKVTYCDLIVHRELLPNLGDGLTDQAAAWA